MALPQNEEQWTFIPGDVNTENMAAQQPDPAFQIIDNALAKYYQRLGYSNYRDNNGNGFFLNYVIDEELNDPDLPIEKELGDDCDPNDCAYSGMNNETEFPIPHYAVIPAQKNEAFMFYVLQYCYKMQQPPSDQYIQQTLIPKYKENRKFMVAILCDGVLTYNG